MTTAALLFAPNGRRQDTVELDFVQHNNSTAVLAANGNYIEVAVPGSGVATLIPMVSKRNTAVISNPTDGQVVYLGTNMANANATSGAALYPGNQITMSGPLYAIYAGGAGGPSSDIFYYTT